eukprot:GHRR01023949.1.p1 GENE.GHRR01023949.1~~GHRR01023949.1.p1  ORF type:complete len:444 (+),score=160.72 GHRR01023949.1:257-1588(+)
MLLCCRPAMLCLLLQSWNFLAGASGVFLFPYISVYLASRGMSPAQIGLLAALRPWLSAPLSLTASAAADKHKLHAQLLLASAATAAVMRSSLPLTDSVNMLFAVYLMAELSGAPVGVLSDSTVLSNCKDQGDYGSIRQWGSIGYGLASLPAGLLIARSGLHLAFLVYGLASLPLLHIASQMRYKYNANEMSNTDSKDGSGMQQHSDRQAVSSAAVTAAASVEPQQGATAASASVKSMLSQPVVLAFLWKCLLMGFGMGIMSTYEFLWLKQLGAPETLMGMAIAVSICTEVPAFTMQGAMLKRVSPPILLDIVLAATALRLFCYAGLPAVGTPWAVLPVELLHGITFGVGWGTATVYSARIAPQHLAATMQGLFQATYAGVGAGLGGLAGGILMQRYGGQGLFTAAAAFVAVGGVAGLLVDQAVSAVRRCKQQQQPASEVEKQQ